MTFSGRHLFLLQAALLILAGFFVFAPAFQGDWLWDDDFQITANLPIQEPAGLWKIWFAPTEPDYFPLKSTLQWVQWQLWGKAPVGYHLATFGCHLLSAFLLWALLRKIRVPGAWLAGLLFTVHPLLVESVAWIAEEKNTLSLPFLLLAMGAYVDYDAGGKTRDRWKSLAWFVGAMLCKSSVAMFPFIILLYAWWKRGRLAYRDFIGAAPFFAVTFVLGLVTLWFQAHRTVGPVASGFPVHALLFYFGKFLFPVDLIPVYPFWHGGVIGWLWLPVAAAVCWTGWKLWGRPFLFGIGFFVLNLLPVLGFFPMAYLQFSPVADHFAYVASLGLIGLAAAGAEGLRQRKRWLAWGIGLIVVLLMFQSHRYAAVFENQETLWSYTAERNPASWLAHYNLGLVRAHQHRMQEAVGEFRAALDEKPDFTDARNNLALSLLQVGQIDEAIAQLRLLIAETPDAPIPHNNLGMILAAEGRNAEAIEEFQAALRLRPDYAKARNNLNRLLGKEN